MCLHDAQFINLRLSINQSINQSIKWQKTQSEKRFVGVKSRFVQVKVRLNQTEIAFSHEQLQIRCEASQKSLRKLCA